MSFGLRDIFPNSLLLESSDYDGRTNNYSYICCNPISTISIKNNDLKITYPDGKNIIKKNLKNNEIPKQIESFSKKFDCKKYKYKFITNGLFKKDSSCEAGIARVVYKDTNLIKEGQFAFGKLNGYGRVCFPTTFAYYIGMFKDGRRYGYGK